MNCLRTSKCKVLGGHYINDLRLRAVAIRALKTVSKCGVRMVRQIGGDEHILDAHAVWNELCRGHDKRPISPCGGGSQRVVHCRAEFERNTLEPVRRLPPNYYLLPL